MPQNKLPLRSPSARRISNGQILQTPLRSGRQPFFILLQVYSRDRITPGVVPSLGGFLPGWCNHDLRISSLSRNTLIRLLMPGPTPPTNRAETYSTTDYVNGDR